LLEKTSAIVPQGKIVTIVAESWKLVWKRMMAELAPQDKTGQYQRPSYQFTGRIGDSEFPDEAGRYHLYTGNPCPWCHRCVLAVKLLGFSQEGQLGWTVLEDNPRKASRGGWIFSSQQPDKHFGGCRDLRELYDTLRPGFQGRCTAPVLVDCTARKIVSNESSDIVRMLNQASLGGGSKKKRINLVPDDLVREIDETNEWVYRLLNNGVYRCGFSTTQAAYDQASADVREGLQKCEERLAENPFLVGPDFTEADLRLLPTVLRFDAAYAPLFKAGGTHLRIRNYPNIHAWLKRCWDNIPGVKESIDLADACGSYYRQLFPLNPGGIVPSSVTAEQLGLE
jgi:putative glutathione S-transferase